MLLELIVENYAVVEQGLIRFQEGLNVLTGPDSTDRRSRIDCWRRLARFCAPDRQPLMEPSVSSGDRAGKC
jgi:hypothetical protein